MMESKFCAAGFSLSRSWLSPKAKDVKRAVNFSRLMPGVPAGKKGRAALASSASPSRFACSSSDDGTRASATGYGDGARREPAIDRNAEVGSQAFHQDIVIHGKDPERRVFPDQGHDACESREVRPERRSGAPLDGG